jgi:hypothetical protein
MTGEFLVEKTVIEINGDLFADSHKILNRWKNYYSQSLNVHRVNDVRQIEIHAAEPLVPDLALLRLKLLFCRVEKV